MKKRSTETKLQTKFGNFVFRVYSANQGQETIVLYKDGLDVRRPVLVRVHSECITGDMFGSLKCDCGEQLEKSLKMINEDGNGALVYLRQEGRGIGLFEKILSYQLQDKGYDTFEANVLLGHGPDQRTYEWAKIALNDLGITEVRLITNNPSKVSEMAKLGIKVVERIPIVIDSNEFNQKYFDAKRDKFKHFFHKEISYYFYQFHANEICHVEEIGQFLKDKNKDPLLKICVGVAANHGTLKDETELEKIRAIFNACSFYEGFVPILHFSFKESENAQEDLIAIKAKMPFVDYLQTNDLAPWDLEAIKLACELFLADIPLWDENFNLVDNEEFRNVIKAKKAFVLLDNSKGTGVMESKDSLMKKIEHLLSYGMNDIAIFGGFGPDSLETYFELRRYYKINFSIDAESKLKTDDQIDLEKTRTYIKQLLRFDDPKQAGLDQTETFLQQVTDEWQEFSVEGKQFKVHPAVFNPAHFPSTKWFKDEMTRVIQGDSTFCEVGCGAGVISCLLAMENPNLLVTATDINPFASETTKLNVQSLGLVNQFDVCTGDVLDGVGKDKKFDSIFWALPFGFLDPGTKVDYRDMQVYDPGYKSTRKFLRQGKGYLKDGGALYLGFSEDLGNYDLLEDIARENNITLEKIAEHEMQEAEVINFEIIKATYN